MNEWWAYAMARSTVHRALASALVVGPILIAINHADAIIHGDLAGSRILKMLLNVCRPLLGLNLLYCPGRTRTPALASFSRRVNGVRAVKSLGSLLAVAPFLLLVACQRDPGRDVKPMADPLRSAGAAAAAREEIIPLDKVSKSQAAAVSQRIANTEITITYSRPVARGRELFGALVPYDQVWNPGADQATAIAVTRDIHVNERPLPAGKYSLWVVPRAETWTVIFSKASDVYHTPYPGEDQDQLRLDVRPESGPHMEVLAFYFSPVEGKDAVLRLHWGTVLVPLSIRVP